MKTHTLDTEQAHGETYICMYVHYLRRASWLWACLEDRGRRGPEMGCQEVHWRTLPSL